MIRVEIDIMDIPTWCTSSNTAMSMYINSILGEHGVPLVPGKPTQPEIDFSKGKLKFWVDQEREKRVYCWYPKEENP